jgi:alanine racemase
MTAPPALRTWAEIDLSAIRHNLNFVRRKVGPGPKILAVIKANAYGHGAQAVAEAIADLVDGFGVASLDEARELIPTPRDVLLLSPVLAAERRDVLAGDFIATVSSAAEAAEFPGGRVSLKIDTGMGRIGCWQDDALSEAQAILRLDAVHLHSISTHLPSPDDAVTTRSQLEAFGALKTALKTNLAPGIKFHVLNSAGILCFPDHAFDLVRPGLMLYGSASPAEFQSLLRPALTWKARVLLVRDLAPGRDVSYGRTFTTTAPTRTAVLPLGYADGFPRQASGHGAEVLIGGQRCPLLGRVTMDQIVVDVTQVPAVQPGDEAVLIGQQGAEEILAADLAAQADTIAWHLFTGLGNRVKLVNI